MRAAATFTAFAGHRMIVSGDLAAVATAVAASDDPTLVFDDDTGQLVELDLRRGPEHAVAEYRARSAAPEEAPPPRPGRGRPRLGVVAREVTLLPRHWDWLAAQPGGASAALRRLVEEARRAGGAGDGARLRRDRVYRTMTTLAGDLPGYEEAARALFAGDQDKLLATMAPWPVGVSGYLQRLISEVDGGGAA